MIEEIGLQVIKLNLPFRLNHVNCFIAEGEDGWKIVDTGLHDENTVKRWDEELKGKKVTDILVTHYHPDHFGYAGALQNKVDAKVSMSKIDAEIGIHAWEELFLNKLGDNYTLLGVPLNIAVNMVNNTREFIPRVTPYPEVDHFFQEGETIEIGKYEYEVIFTRGHSDGLVNFYNKEKRILLSTDHILPKITPNISYWFHGDSNPLATFFQSLQKIRKLDADFVIPSHGEPFYGANNRIDEIIIHHKDRLSQTLEAISNNSGTVYEICSNLFPKIKSIHETRFAVGETLAHLEYLRLKGDCNREIKEGVYQYYI